ncbi:hypothetical protein BGZ58_004639, partial [Dissophora ornata]
YKALTGFIPFREQQQGFFPSTVSRLAVLAVYNAVRAHYYGAKFPDDMERPDDVNAIDFFFEKNAQHREFADFAKAKFAHGFVFLSEADLAHIFFSNAETKPIISRELGVTASSAAETMVTGKKGILIEKLLYRLDPVKRFDGYYKKVSLQSDRQRRTKFKLRGTICTNGLVLHLLAHDTTTTRRRATPLPHQISKGDDDDDDEDDGEALFRDLNEDYELDDAFLESGRAIQIQQSTSLVAAGDPGKMRRIRGVSPEAESSKRQRLSTPQPPPAGQGVAALPSIPAHTIGPTSGPGTVEVSKSTINWKRGSKMLENVEVRFSTSNVCPPADTVVIGIDPGEVYTMKATRVDPLSTKRESVRIRRSFLYRPYTIFRHLLEERKAAHGISELEARIPSFRVETIEEYLAYLEAPGTDGTTARIRLCDFYSSRWMVRKRWDVRKAQQATYDYAVAALLGLAKDSVSQSQGSQTGPQVVFAIGLGSFDSQTGLPSKHGVLEKMFVSKAKSSGYTVIGAHEYYTSARCPRDQCLAFLENDKRRSKYCRSCQMYFDRDIVGSENIATVCLSQIQHQCRPAKFMPSS